MNARTMSAAAAAILIAFAGASLTAQAAGIETLQKKIDSAAQKAGVRSPDVKAELAGQGQARDVERPTIKRMASMPASQIRAIQGSDGSMIYLVDNGRFAFAGTLVDIWNRKKISNIDEFNDAISHIDLRRMGFRLKETNHISVGSGAKRVTAFVDTRCGWCHRLLEEIKADPELLKEFTFDIVIMTVLGDESGALGKKLFCAKTTDPMEKFSALVGGKSAIEKLAQQDKCDTKILRSTALQQQAMNIMSVPFVISPDKRFVRGKPNSLREFLNEEEARRAAARAEAERNAELNSALEAIQESGAQRKPLRKSAR